MKDPAFLFYSSDFLTGCINLTMKERGQYITLLCTQHQKGHLDEKTIRLVLGFDDEDRNIEDILSPDVLAKFKKDSKGHYYNERLDIEIEKRLIFTESRRKNGQLGGRPPKDNNKPNGYPNGYPNDKPSQNLPENEVVVVNINKNIKEILRKYILIKLKENIYDFVEKNFGRTLSSVEVKFIDKWKLVFTEDILKHAVKIAIYNGKPIFNYVDGILNNWKILSYKTLAQILADEDKRNARKNKNNEIPEIPDYNWLDDHEEGQNDY